MEYQEKLDNWAKKVVDRCHEIATTSTGINKAFYAFQSNPNIIKPKVLILGINPGEDYSYQEQLQNTCVWESNNGKLSYKRFLQENHFWSEHEKWTIWRNIRNVFHTPKLKEIIDSESYIYMNALYFNSINIDDFFEHSNAKVVFNECIEFTKELIRDIVKPECIICLSIPECFEKLNETETELLLNGKIRMLTKGEFCGIPTYGIPHPSSARFMRNEDWNNIGTILHREVFKEDAFGNLNKNIDEISTIFDKIANKHNLALVFNKEKMSGQFGSFGLHSKDLKGLSIIFEFESPNYSNLHYGINVKHMEEKPSESDLMLLGYQNNSKFLYEWGWINLMRCEKYNNWMMLEENFHKKDFEDYFDGLISELMLKLKKKKN